MKREQEGSTVPDSNMNVTKVICSWENARRNDDRGIVPRTAYLIEKLDEQQRAWP
jgi:hypothetical protein